MPSTPLDFYISPPNRLSSPSKATHRANVPYSRSIGGLSTRSKIGREEIKWQELLTHFRSVQAKHEKARRQALGADVPSFSNLADIERPEAPSHPPPPSGRMSVSSNRPQIRRKVTGGEIVNANANAAAGRAGALSPLNPRARVPALASAMNAQQTPTPAGAPGKGRRSVDLGRK